MTCSVKMGLGASAKIIDQYQPTQSAQAAMGRYFLLLVGRYFLLLVKFVYVQIPVYIMIQAGFFTRLHVTVIMW